MGSVYRLMLHHQKAPICTIRQGTIFLSQMQLFQIQVMLGIILDMIW